MLPNFSGYYGTGTYQAVCSIEISMALTVVVLIWLFAERKRCGSSFPHRNKTLGATAFELNFARIYQCAKSGGRAFGSTDKKLHHAPTASQIPYEMLPNFF